MNDKEYQKKYRETHKEEKKTSQKRWYLNNKESQVEISRHSNYLREYGISLAEYNVLYSEQGNVCAICKQPETKTNKKTGTIYKLAVDHCHDTKKVRGLLCHKCNVALGLFSDSVYLLNNAMEYLENNG